MKTLLAILALSSYANAGQFKFNKQVNSYALQNELKAKGFNVESIQCLNTECVIYFNPGEKKNPSEVIKAHKYVDPAIKQKALLKALEALSNQ